MKITICPRCGKKFKYNTKLRRHLARKTPCAHILEPEDLTCKAREDPELYKKRCPYCGRAFASYSSMRQHVRQSCKIVPNKKNGDRGMELLYEHTIKKQNARIARLEEQNNEMLTMMRQMSTQQGSSSNLQSPPISNNTTTKGEVVVQGNSNRTMVDNKKIIINVFGKENIDHIDSAQIKAILDESMTNALISDAASTALLETALKAYSDPEHPENLTCYLSNKKTDDALIHTENGWEVCPVRLVLTPIAKQSLNTLFDKQPYENAKHYENIMRELRDNAHLRNKRDLRPILVRNKALLLNALKRLPTATKQ